ncbi:MAG: hypothetical protein HYY18_17055 [Planctomycetes bacterium]|nr:hypothetical protein [Planctomycetota bacterium]
MIAGWCAAEEPVQSPRSALSMPRPDSVDRYVVLTNVAVDDAWNTVVDWLMKRHNAPVIRFAGEDPTAARPDLLGMAPGTVAVVVKPESLDVDFVYRLLEAAASLDADFALDFRLAFVTGLSPKHAVDLLERERRVEQDRSLFPRRLVDFGPSEADLEVEGEQAWLEGWERLLARHLKTSEAEVRKLEGAGVVQFWGYGRPEGIAGSVDAGQLAAVNLFPAVAFGGPIYTGVTHRYFEGPVSAAPRPIRVTPIEKSFALALLASGATGVFGATDPGHGVTAMQEMEHLLSRGATLSETHKAIADAALLFLRETPLRLPKIAEGKVAPSRDWGAVLARGALSRIAFGDPAYRPADAAGKGAFTAEKERLENGIRVKVTITDARLRATLTSVFAYGFGRKDALLNARVLVAVDWPDDMPLPVRLRILDARSGARDVRVGPAAAAVELWGARRIVHVQLDFPAQSLTTGTEIRFLLRTGAAGEDQDRETLFEASRASSDVIAADREAAGTAGRAEPLRHNLWDGAAGVALFQMNPYRASGDGTQGARARALLDDLVRAARVDVRSMTWEDTWRMPDGTLATLARDGLHSGTAGVGCALVEGFRIYGDRRYLDAATAAGERLEAAAKRENGLASWGDDTTVAGGAAGIVLFLLDLAEITNDARWTELAVAGASWLDSVKTPDPRGVAWRAQTSLPRTWTGLAHGTAGVALALLRVWEVTKDVKWFQLVEKAAAWLEAAAVREEDGALWPAIVGEGNAAPVAGWSYGTAGIARFFLRLHARSKNPAHLDLAVAGGRGVKRLMDAASSRPFESAGFESGAAGIGEMLLDLFEATRDGSWLDEARRTADLLRTQGAAAPGPFAARPEGADSAVTWEGEGLYRGAAGVGMYYLRLATIDMDVAKRPRQSPERR